MIEAFFVVSKSDVFLREKIISKGLIYLKTKQLVEISMLVALALVLDFVAGLYSRWLWLQGGSISLSLVPLAILAYRQGVKIGLLGAILMGAMQLLIGGYIFHPVQVLLDYPVAFGALGLVGLWTKIVDKRDQVTVAIVISTFIASFFRWVSHTLSGYVFFAQWAPEGMGALWFSMTYNFGYVFFSWLASMIVLILLYRYHPKLVQT